MRILIDFDSTIANSCETIIKLYQNKVGEFSTIHLNELQWDFQPYIPNEDLWWALSMFGDEKFYKLLKPIDNCVEVLKELHDLGHELIICTKKQAEYVPINDKWIREYLPFIDRVIYLRQSGFEKHFINADFRIDDKPECLIGGNGFKILFGDYGYQNVSIDDKGILRIKTWEDVGKFIKSCK